MSARITSVFAREILDSRGNPTVEVELCTEKGFGMAAAPSGASTGIFEAVELRDGRERFLGKGVSKAVYNVNKIIGPKLIGMDAEEQENIDKLMIELDGTENKSRLGGNATVAISMAVLRAAANGKQIRLYEYLGGKKIPTPCLNILNGGKHAGGKLSIQEFMIVPDGISGFKEQLRAASEVYHTLGKILVKKYGVGARNVGDEGGFAPQMKEGKEALEAICKAIGEAGYKKKINIALDSAASSFFEKGKYLLDGKKISKEKLLEYYLNLVKKYPIVSIEDPFEEEDFESFAQLKKELKGKARVVGDDLVVTNPNRIKKAIEKRSMDVLLLKINQIGTVTEALEAAQLCKRNGLGIMVSHRSGETEDTFIADFSVGIEAEYIKTGAPARGERTAKYNQLLRIEERIEGMSKC